MTEETGPGPLDFTPASRKKPVLVVLALMGLLLLGLFAYFELPVSVDGTSLGYSLQRNGATGSAGPPECRELSARTWQCDYGLRVMERDDSCWTTRGEAGTLHKGCVTVRDKLRVGERLGLTD